MKYLLLLLSLLIGFIPYFGTIDKIGSQWFYLTIVNFFFLFYFIFIKISFVNHIKSLFSFSFLKFYVVFIFLAFISIFYAYNYTLSIVDFSRLVTSALLFFNLSILFCQFNFDLLKLSTFVSLILFCEIIYSFNPVFIFLKTSSFYEIDFSTIPNALRGVTGNKNVAASNFVFKLPFVFFLFLRSKFIFNKISALILIFLTVLTLSLLSARASLLSLFFISFIFVAYLLLSNIKNSYKTVFPLLFSIIAPFILTSFYATNLSIENRISSINTNDTSTNYRLILWDNAIDFITMHPFIGCGLGNWKVESLPYWKDKLTGYTIPYHAHNDFLELTTELGIAGGLFYLSVFISIAYAVLFKFSFKKYSAYFILSLLFVYFIDAFLNFPLERAISQVNFSILLLTSFLFLKDEKKYFY